MKTEESVETVAVNPALVSQQQATKLPPGVDAEAVRLKMAAGLTRDQAIEVILNQQEHEKTQPHDAPPKKPTAAPKPWMTGGMVRPPLPENLEDLSVDELKDLAAERDIEVNSDNPDEIIRALRAG